MTVKELIQFLNYYPEDILVIMSADSEGNYYGPLDGLVPCEYTPESDWNGTIVDAGMEDKWDPEINKVNAVCFWPR